MNISHLIKAGLLATCVFVGQTYATPTTPKVAAQQELAAGSALLMDLKTNEILYSSNPNFVAPIASVTKLMTAMVVLDAQQSLTEKNYIFQ